MDTLGNKRFPPLYDLYEYVDGLKLNDTIPIAFFASRFQSFNVNAILDSTIYVDSNGIYQFNNSSTTTKYDVGQILMIAPTANYYYGNSFNFILSDSLFTFNHYEEVDSIYMNFDDGLGLRKIEKDTLFNVFYIDPGWKNIKSKVFFENDSIYYSYSKINIQGKNLSTYIQPTIVDRLNIPRHYKNDGEETFNDSIRIIRTLKSAFNTFSQVEKYIYLPLFLLIDILKPENDELVIILKK